MYSTSVREMKGRRTNIESRGEEMKQRIDGVGETTEAFCNIMYK
jgi:hypothetical protein